MKNMVHSPFVLGENEVYYDSLSESCVTKEASKFKCDRLPSEGLAMTFHDGEHIRDCFTVAKVSMKIKHLAESYDLLWKFYFENGGMHYRFLVALAILSWDPRHSSKRAQCFIDGVKYATDYLSIMPEFCPRIRFGKSDIGIRNFYNDLFFFRSSLDTHVDFTEEEDLDQIFTCDAVVLKDGRTMPAGNLCARVTHDKCRREEIRLRYYFCFDQDESDKCFELPLTRSNAFGYIIKMSMKNNSKNYITTDEGQVNGRDFCVSIKSTINSGGAGEKGCRSVTIGMAGLISHWVDHEVHRANYNGAYSGAVKFSAENGFNPKIDTFSDFDLDQPAKTIFTQCMHTTEFIPKNDSASNNFLVAISPHAFKQTCQTLKFMHNKCTRVIWIDLVLSIDPNYYSTAASEARAAEYDELFSEEISISPKHKGIDSSQYNIKEEEKKKEKEQGEEEEEEEDTYVRRDKKKPKDDISTKLSKHYQVMNKDEGEEEEEEDELNKEYTGSYQEYNERIPSRKLFDRILRDSIRNSPQSQKKRKIDE